MKVAFLTSHASAYFVACLQTFVDIHRAKVLLCHWQQGDEFPYTPKTLSDIRILTRSPGKTELKSDIERFSPDVVYISGWMDSEYLAIAEVLRASGIPVVCGIDNPWTGSIRQRVACVLARSYLRKRFSHAWVAGPLQNEFARRLGFADNKIVDGLYSADTLRFANSLGGSKFGKSLLYVGRLVQQKNLELMIHVYRSLTLAERNGWTLTLCGTGPMKETLHCGDGVRVAGFVQPSDLPTEFQKHSAAILPSIREPWGVVLHEFAAASLPILASWQCGAASRLVINGANGFLFDARLTDSMRTAMTRLFSLSESKLYEFGSVSNELARFNSPKIWAHRLAAFHQSLDGQNPF